MSDYSKILKARRKEMGLSQEEVAKAVGVSQRAYSLWEDGQRNPKAKSLIKLEQILGTELLRTKENQNFDMPIENRKEVGAFNQNILLEFAMQSNEARIKELKEHNAFLQRMLESNLDSTRKAALASLVYHKAWIERVARVESAGDARKKKAILDEMDTIMNDLRENDENTNNAT